MQVDINCVVELSYKMNFVGDEELIESFHEKRPLEIIVGIGEMLPAFEEEIIGKKVGEYFSFVIPKEKAFGDFDDSLVTSVPIETFYDQNGKIDDRIIFEGAIVTMDTDDGEEQDAFILEIDDEEVLIDFNHPFAGEDLQYEGRILSVRLSD
ncbi:MAG: FKBP-type peptidyl-prolyl cis-trans isomerase [Bacteroidales bacterium]|nr:FKBP-type peptidyl-prolyl cis-trans isomerase [Bacteroidales bacterium]